MRKATAVWRLLIVAIGFGILVALPANASALQNPGCLGCHAAVGDMAVPDVDRDTACRSCHLSGFVGSHPYHQAGSNCGGACHPGWGDSLLTATPSYIDPVSGASFASASSKGTSPAVLHIIHSERRWPAGVSTISSACASCHEAAACNACHVGVVSADHAAHSTIGNVKYPKEPSWAGMVARGVTGDDQTQQTAAVETNQCAAAGCHALEESKSRRPRSVEDYNYAAGENPHDLAGASTAVSYVGTWRTRANTMYSGARMSYQNVAGARLDATFTGTYVELVSDKDPYRGTADVYIDDKFAATVDCYSSVTKRQAVVFSSAQLQSGTHAISVRPTGTRNASARADFVVVDAFKVYSDTPDSVAPYCGGCHATASHAVADHSGTDAAVRLARGNRGGCSDTPAKGQTCCHSLTDLSTLHVDIPGGGCSVCHSIGGAPARECRTCHPTGRVGGGAFGAPMPAGYSSSVRLTPSGDDTLTAGMTVSPVSPTTRFDKVDETASDGDATYVNFTDVGRAVFGFGAAPSIPASATITNVTVYYTLRYVSGTVPSNAGASLKVGGAYFDDTAPSNATTGYLAKNFVFATNPKTGAAWTRDQIVSQAGTDSLQGIGVYSGDAVPNVRVTLCYAVVNYAVPPYVVMPDTYVIHHYNNRYLIDQADAVPGEYHLAANPAGGWSAQYLQDCNFRCHLSYYGSAWNAYAGTMWYSLPGQAQGIPEVRTLTLDAGELPDAAQLSFKTRWKFDVGSATRGYVEASTDDGATWTTLSGTVFGAARSEYTDNSAASWGDAVYDLSAYAGTDTRLRFRYHMPANTYAEGWTIDAVSITGSSGLYYSDDVETLKPEWTSVQWSREPSAMRNYGY